MFCGKPTNKLREIGSEFWLDGTCQNNGCMPNGSNVAWLLSGRTALDFIIRDIKANGKLKSVSLPAYCCEAMVTPFVNNDVTVRFYDVNVDGISVATWEDTDAVFLMDFFGYETGGNTSVAKAAHKAGKTIIYDATHKINGNYEVERCSDYSFCSYRKWFYCNAAKAEKHTGDFSLAIPNSCNSAYCLARDKAAKLKSEYMRDGTTDKNEFRRLYSEAESMLDRDYRDYVGTSVSFDAEHIIRIRRRNAERLINGLSGVSGIQLWRGALKTKDVPLFLPILIEPPLRNILKEHLVQQNIYTPVHWPKSTYYAVYNDLYDKELSLICDQRYDDTDIDREISAIKCFFDKGAH